MKRGNPWHDEKGRFCSGPKSRASWEYKEDGSLYLEVYSDESKEQVEKTKTFTKREIEVNGEEVINDYLRIRQSYDQEKVDRLSSELMEMKPDEKEFGEKIRALHTEMERNRDYRNACEKRKQLVEQFNESALPLYEKSLHYNEMVNKGIPCDAGDIVAESDRARQLFEEYLTHDKETKKKFEENLKEIREHAADGNPFYRDKHRIMNTPKRKGTCLPYEPGKKNGFEKSVTDYESVEFNRSINEASALRDEDREETLGRFNELMAGKKKTYENVSSAFRTLYTEKPICDRFSNFISLDIETNSLSPAEGNIIEFGAVEVSPFGEEVGRYEQLYDVSPKQLEVNGMGAEYVHHISHDMVAGKKQFKEDTENVLAYMKRGTVVVHNKNFELNWFRQQIPGFCEAEQNGEIKVVDTMNICRKLCDTERNTLQSFVEHTGGSYENAHRSTEDARMTIDALFRWSIS